MFKKNTVVMIPTNQESEIVLKINGELLLLPTGHIGTRPSKLTQPQHLYFLSDEEIKEGDWFINMSNNLMYKSKGYGVAIGVDKKIIATTDDSLGLVVDKNGCPMPAYSKFLPQPSHSFIEKFVEEYNKGNVITEVMVEYTDEVWGNAQLIIPSKPKINPKDNTITIRKVNLKGEHVLNFVNDFIKEFPEENLEYLKLRAESWIEQNL